MVSMTNQEGCPTTTGTEDDVRGYCDVQASAGEFVPVTLPLVSTAPATVGVGDRVDGWREPGPSVVDPATVAIWSCQLTLSGIQPANQP